MSRRGCVVPALMAVLALAGCGPDTSTPQGQCEAQAYDDPTVKDLVMRGATNTATMHELAPYLADAKQAATERCLRARGLIAPGGVQKELPKR